MTLTKALTLGSTKDTTEVITESTRLTPSNPSLIQSRVSQLNSIVMYIQFRIILLLLPILPSFPPNLPPILPPFLAPFSLALKIISLTPRLSFTSHMAHPDP